MLALRNAYLHEFAWANEFISIHRDGFNNLGNIAVCIRYLRQYLPLHMPRIEYSVQRAFEGPLGQQQHVHVLDIGCGPGSLYCVLACLLHRNALGDCTIDISMAEPSQHMHTILRVIAEHVHHERLHRQETIVAGFREMAAQLRAGSIDWFYMSNVVDQLAAGEGGPTPAARRLRTTIRRLRRPGQPTFITIAENTTGTTTLSQFCDVLRNMQLDCDVERRLCPAPWLAHCDFYVTKRPPMTTASLSLVTAIAPPDW